MEPYNGKRISEPYLRLVDTFADRRVNAVDDEARARVDNQFGKVLDNRKLPDHIKQVCRKMYERRARTEEFEL